MKAMRRCLLGVLVTALGAGAALGQETRPSVEVRSLAELAAAAAKSGQVVRMVPGVYRMSEYLTEEVLAGIKKDVQGEGRRPVWMMKFAGSGNRFDLRGVTIEIDTGLYAKLPSGYMRCLFMTGNENRVEGLTVKNAGKDVGSNGNVMSVWGEHNVVEGVTLEVWGSFPHGYGDLLGKGGPNIVKPLQKQSGMMIGGEGNVVRRCKVLSRAFGHCFYIQNSRGARVEDCYAEGEMRRTEEMLKETAGPAFELGFRSVYENRDGRYLITPGYTKSLSEDGFRTYGNARETTIVNCVAVNTRAGFEIGGSADDKEKTVVEGCMASGCERGYLIGSNVVVRRSRGDVRFGPLLYLRQGTGSDVELELAGKGPETTVHAVATIAGVGQRVKLTGPKEGIADLPIMLGFDMPMHAEMATPILPAVTKGVRLVNDIPQLRTIQSAQAAECVVESAGRVVRDEETKKAP